MHVLCRNWITALRPKSPKLRRRLSRTAVARWSFVIPCGGVCFDQFSSIKKYLFLNRTMLILTALWWLTTNNWLNALKNSL